MGCGSSVQAVSSQPGAISMPSTRRNNQSARSAATTSQIPERPSAPVVIRGFGSDELLVSWSANGSNTDGFVLEKRLMNSGSSYVRDRPGSRAGSVVTASSNATQWIEVPLDSPSMTKTVVKTGKVPVAFRVTAFNSHGQSKPSMRSPFHYNGISSFPDDFTLDLASSLFGELRNQGSIATQRDNITSRSTGRTMDTKRRSSGSRFYYQTTTDGLFEVMVFLEDVNGPEFSDFANSYIGPHIMKGLVGADVNVSKLLSNVLGSCEESYYVRYEHLINQHQNMLQQQMLARSPSQTQLSSAYNNNNNNLSSTANLPGSISSAAVANESSAALLGRNTSATNVSSSGPLLTRAPSRTTLLKREQSGDSLQSNPNLLGPRDYLTSGSSAVAVVIDRRNAHNQGSFEYCPLMHVASVGNARAVLVRSNHLIQVAGDHLPSHPFEQERIFKNGGNVASYGRIGRIVPGGLNYSRALGCLAYKRQYPNILLSEPKVTSMEVAYPPDEGILFGNLEIWSCLSPEDIYTFFSGESSEEILTEIINFIRRNGYMEYVHLALARFLPDHSRPAKNAATIADTSIDENNANQSDASSIRSEAGPID